MAWASVLVLANFVAQVPYGVHLYGARALGHGAAPLAPVLAWFVAGLWLLARGSRAGVWLTLSFVLADFAFYLYNLLGGWAHGYGLFFHLWTATDPLLWAVFLVGYLNFFAAGYIAWQLRPGRRRD